MNVKLNFFLLVSLLHGVSYTAQLKTPEKTKKKHTKRVELLKTLVAKDNEVMFRKVVEQAVQDTEKDQNPLTLSTILPLALDLIIDNNQKYTQILFDNGFDPMHQDTITLKNKDRTANFFCYANKYGNEDFLQFLLQNKTVKDAIKNIDSNELLFYTSEYEKKSERTFHISLFQELITDKEDINYEELSKRIDTLTKAGISIHKMPYKVYEKDGKEKKLIYNLKFLGALLIEFTHYIKKEIPLDIAKKAIAKEDILEPCTFQYFYKKDKKGKKTLDYTEHNYALNIAIESQKEEIAKLLLEQGANPNKGFISSNGVKFTPLMTAIETNDKEIIKTLLEYNADVSELNYYLLENGEVSPSSSQEYAFYLNKIEILELLDKALQKKEDYQKIESKDFYKKYFAEFEDEEKKEKKPKTKDQKRKQAKTKKTARKERSQEELSAREQEEEIVIVPTADLKESSGLKKGPVAFKKRVTDWFKNPERALKIQGYLEDSPQPDPFKRALYHAVGRERIIEQHRFPRAIDTTILYDDNYGKVEKQEGDTYTIKVPGHIKKESGIVFGQFEYVFYIKENGTRVILHRFFRELTINELEKTFKPAHGWGNMNSIASLEKDSAKETAAGPAESESGSWQSEFEKDDWTHHNNTKINMRIFTHPKIKTEYGIKKQKE
jgi:hypothetical protein